MPIMTITTSKGKTWGVIWAYAPVGDDEDLMIEVRDDRHMAQIAEDWEGCDRIERCSDTEGDAVYEGYTRIRSIVRRRGDIVQVTLMKA